MSSILTKYLPVKLAKRVLLLSLVLLSISNIWFFLSELVRGSGTTSLLSFVFILLVFLSAIVGLTAWWYLFKRDPARKHETKSNPPAYSIPEGYLELFSRDVDPIGNLYVWKVIAEQRSGYLEYGPQVVTELENFLERHCDIRRIGSFGEVVRFDPRKYVFLQSSDEFESHQDIPARGASVKIIEPGWQWGELHILRQPRVR